MCKSRTALLLPPSPREAVRPGLLGNPELWRIISSISPTRIRCSEHHRHSQDISAYLHETYNPSRPSRPPHPVLHSSSTLTATHHSRYSCRSLRNTRRLNARGAQRARKSRVTPGFVLVTPSSGLAELNR